MLAEANMSGMKVVYYNNEKIQLMSIKKHYY